LIAGALLAALAGVILLVLWKLRGPVDWNEEWIAPPEFGAAMADLSSGRVDEADKRLQAIFKRYRSAVWRRRAWFAEGVSRLRRREFTKALDLLSKAESGGGPLAGFASLNKASALLGAGKPGDAVKALDLARNSHPNPILADDLAVLRARALAAAGDRSGAARSLEEFSSSGGCADPARVLESAARLHQDAGEADMATALFRRVYFEQPRSPEATRAASELSAQRPSVRFKASDLPAVSARSRSLIAAGDGKGALATWDLLLSSIPATALSDTQILDISEAAIEAKEPLRALPLLGRIPAGRDPTRRALLMGRALFALGRDSEAISMLRKAADGPSEESGTSRFLLATGLDQNDHDREALDQFNRYLRDHRSGDRFPAAAWRAGWLSYRLGKPDESRRLFQMLLDRPEATAYHPSARYWLARASEGGGRRPQAVEIYARLSVSNARDYYGILAKARLRTLGAAQVAAEGAAARGSSKNQARGESPQATIGSPSRAFCTASRIKGAGDLVLAGCELETVGLFQDAEREYEAAAAVQPERPLLLRLCELELHRGDRSQAIARLKSAVPDYLSAPIESLPMRFWELLYPRREWDRIREASLANHLDPHLVCGLILQESAFNPLAVSSAGAMGLMQVLPDTGREAASQTGITAFSAARLFEPATNLKVGTWHLASILSKADGRVEIALAAYNAGEGRLARWKTLFGTSDPTTFVEDIPFTETRLYVKRIVSHAAMYHAIYGD
jgi:soluble lytic murein transglycosylase